jgi:hypothetical protein
MAFKLSTVMTIGETPFLVSSNDGICWATLIWARKIKLNTIKKVLFIGGKDTYYKRVDDDHRHRLFII